MSFIRTITVSHGLVTGVLSGDCPIFFPEDNTDEALFVPGSGATGAIGPTGAKGAQGIQGMTGVDGEDGADAAFVPGPTGATGARGVQGVQGMTGVDGENGEDPLFVPGPMGPTGGTGATGAVGLQGMRGMDGEDAESIINIPGPTGPTGATGPPGLSGSSGVGLMQDDYSADERPWIPYVPSPLAVSPYSIVTNGNFNVVQRNVAVTSLGAATVGWWCDRWFAWLDTGMTATMSVSTPALAPNTQSITCFQTNVTLAQASITGAQYSSVIHPIEGYDSLPVIGIPFTVGFWVRATKVGTYCVYLSNYGNDRSCVLEYKVITTNTWEYKAVTFPASPSAGTWNYTTGTGLHLGFCLAAGPTIQTTPGVWQTGLFVGTANQVNSLDAALNTFALSQVQITPGNIAAPFVGIPYADELLRCQRFYQASGGNLPNWFSGNVTSGVTYYCHNLFTVTMRAAPTLVLTNIGASGFPTTTAAQGATTIGFYEARVANATALGSYFQSNYTASADIL